MKWEAPAYSRTDPGATKKQLLGAGQSDSRACILLRGWWNNGMLQETGRNERLRQRSPNIPFFHHSCSNLEAICRLALSASTCRSCPSFPQALILPSSSLRLAPHTALRNAFPPLLVGGAIPDMKNGAILRNHWLRGEPSLIMLMHEECRNDFATGGHAMVIQRTSLTILIVLMLVGEMGTALHAAEPASSMKTGFAERDITPEIGSEKPGGYGKSYHKTLHDPCKVRAAVFDDGSERVALVGVDALIVPRSMVVGARKRIQERCGIPGDHVLIGASHSHSSGPVGMVIPGEYDHASPLVQDLAYKKSSGADAQYLKRVEQAVADAVVEADKNRQDAQCGVGKGIEDTVAFNRRFRMKNGRSHTHPGQGNPDIVETAGPTDPEVGSGGGLG